jgi:hypothetical protein
VKKSENWRLVRLKKQVVGARLAEATVTKTNTLVRVSRTTVSNVNSAAYLNHGKTTSAKRNSMRKSTLTERDLRTFRRIVSKNYTTTVTGFFN